VTNSPFGREYYGQVDMDWAARIIRKTKAFLRKNSLFVSDDLTKIMGTDLPADLRHTGYVVRTLKDRGLIEDTGDLRKVDAGTHYRPVYRSTVSA
jgi:hypothetical protein